MTSHSESIAVRILRWLSGLVCRHPHLVWVPQLILFVLCIFYTKNNLEFDTSRNNLVGADKKYHKVFLEFKKEFPAQDDIVVVVESESLEKNRQFVERLGSKLEGETNLFTDVFFKGDLKMMGPKALLFVPQDQLKELQQTIVDYKPFINQFTRATNLVSLFSLINTQFRTAKQEDNAENQAMVKALPALERIVGSAAQSMRLPGTPPSPGISALFGAGEEAERESYITFAEGRLYLVTARARDETVNVEAVDRLRDLVAQTQLEITGVNVGITGEPVIERDETAQSEKDSTRATVVSLILCSLIFIFAYREVNRPIKATLCLIVGLGYTMGFTTLAVGHLNILTVTFAPILVGLAIDFGVHLITRYEEELRNGRSQRVAIEKAMVNTGLGIFTGALTTAVAFLAMGLTDFKGIQEMGIICGGGLILCLVPMMTLLPVLLLSKQHEPLPEATHQEISLRSRVESLWLSRPLPVIFCSLILCAMAAVGARKVYFDYNLLNMQSEGLAAVVYEHKLLNSANKSVLFGAVVADSLAEAQVLEKKFTHLPSVASIESMSRFLAEDSPAKLDSVRKIQAEVTPIDFARVDQEPINVKELSRVLWAQQGYLGLAAEATRKEDPKLSQQLLSLRTTIGELRKEMLSGHPEATHRLALFQQALFNDIRQTFDSLKQQKAEQLRVEDLPPALRNRFIGVTGKYLLMVYPKEDIWQREHQTEFVRQLRTVVPNATGTPVQLYEYTTLLKESYQIAAYYALAAIVIMVYLHFRSMTCVILSLLPVGVGFLWLLGIMGLFGIPFNPANIMTLPLVVGIGVTNGIHILNRFAEEQNPGILAKSTGKAVLVSGLNTIVGFGSLIIAKHQGIASLGLVMAIGVTTCLIAGLTLLPALLNRLIKVGWSIKKPSAEPGGSALGLEEPQ